MNGRTVRRLRPRVRCIVLALLLCSCGVAGSAAAPQNAASDEYLGLVDRYLAGDTRAAVLALSDQEDKWVESALSGVVRNAAAWPVSRLEAAVLLHTEVVAGGWVLPSHAPTHLGAARRFIEVSRGTRVTPRFRHDWLLAVCWHFQSEMELGAVVPWLDELRTRFPEDGEASLAAGIFYEVVGWSGEPPADLTWTNGSKTLGALPHRNRRDALNAAEAAYRRAMQTPATRTQATVRLGRVLAELDRPDEARRLLAPLAAEATERRWRYLAALFTGLAEAHAGRAAAEAASYERAANIMVGCQTPLVGLTALRRLQGQPLEAAELAGTLTRDVKACDDPWWFYRFGQPPDRLPQLLRDMRPRLE